MIKIGKLIKAKFKYKDKADYLVLAHFEFRGFLPRLEL